MEKNCLALLLALFCVELSASLPVDSAAIHSAAAHPIQRRKVGELNSNSSFVVLEYMKDLMSGLTDEDGNPQYDEDNPTNVWGFVDKDFCEGNYREKTRAAGKCTTQSRYIFNWETLVEANNSKHVPLQKGILRAYMETIPRHFAEGETILVDITAGVIFHNGSHWHNGTDTIYAGQHQLNVTVNSNEFVEVEITEGLQILWSQSQQDTKEVEIEIILFLSVDCEQHKKVPITFINPAEIPLEQEIRRERHANRQPILVVYLNDEEAKQILKNEQNVPEEGDDVGKLLGSERVRRTPSDSCHLQNFSLSFVDVQLYNILSPQTVNIRQCVGYCSHTDLKRNPELANNHAKVMASAHVSWQLEPEIWMEEPSEPCCVPTAYNSLFIILQHRDDAIELSLYPEFVATTCGCR